MKRCIFLQRQSCYMKLLLSFYFVRLLFGYVQIGITKYVYGGACDLNWAKVVTFRLIYLHDAFRF